MPSKTVKIRGKLFKIQITLGKNSRENVKIHIKIAKLRTVKFQVKPA